MPINNMISLKKVFYFLIFLIWSTNFTTSVYYGIFLIIILLFILVLADKKSMPFSSIEDKIALSFLLVWGYGIILGYLNGNNIQYILSNFAGMSCYIVYFVFSSLKCSLKEITPIVLFSGLILSIYAIIRLFAYLAGVSIPFLNTDIGISSTGQLRVYFTTLAVSYSLLGISLYSFLSPRGDSSFMYLDKKIFSLLYLILGTLSLLFAASSKGFSLGCIVLFVLIPFFMYVKKALKGKIPVNIVALLILFVLIISALIYYDYFSIIEDMFDKDDVSNSVRYDQLMNLVLDSSFWGKGLGAIVPGVIRSEEAPYGFELTFINLIHKFGAMSLILFFNWIYMFISLASFIIKRQQSYYSIIAFSSLGYLFPSIGNPLLMHPSLVILNCFTLYSIKQIRRYDKNIGLYGCI